SIEEVQPFGRIGGYRFALEMEHAHLVLGGRVAERGRALPELDGPAGVALHRQAVPVQVAERIVRVTGAIGRFSRRVRGTALQPRDAGGLEVTRVALREHQLALHRL